MNQKSLSIGRVFGIPIRIHISWVLIFLLFTWTLAAKIFPSEFPNQTLRWYWFTGAITCVLLFASVLLHELAHSVVAKRRGMEVRDIVLFVFGGVSEITEEPNSPETEFLMTIVGPLTSVAIAMGSGALWLVTRKVNMTATAIFGYLGLINISLAIFNLIPGFPLDGGRLLRAIVWATSGNLLKATRWATRTGVFISYLFMFFGIWQFISGQWLSGMWLALIGFFINSGAQTGYHRTLLKHSLMGHAVGEVMNQYFPRIPLDLNLDELVHNYIIAQGIRCIPVVEGDRLLGIVTLNSIKGASRHQWAEMSAADVTIPLDKVKHTEPNKGLWSALKLMTEQGVNQLPVLEGERLVGMLKRDSILGFLRIRAELEI